MLGAEGGREVGGQGVEAGSELLHPLLQGQHLALQVLTAVVELRHELIHDALHLQEGERGEGEMTQCTQSTLKMGDRLRRRKQEYYEGWLIKACLKEKSFGINKKREENAVLGCYSRRVVYFK